MGQGGSDSDCWCLEYHSVVTRRWSRYSSTAKQNVNTQRRYYGNALQAALRGDQEKLCSCQDEFNIHG